MRFIVNNIHASVKQSDFETLERFKKQYVKNSCANVYIHKKSIDARKKDDIKYVFSFLIETSDKGLIKKLKKQKNTAQEQKSEIKAVFGDKSVIHKPVVVGAGPAGLFCAYFLAKYGYNPIILERGEKIEDRAKTVEKFHKSGILNENSNVQFGEGGAGAFSDGKLTTRISDPIAGDIVRILSECSGIGELTYLAKAHIGTDKLYECVINLRKIITDMGGEFRFCDKLKDIKTENGKIASVISEQSGEIPCEILVLATGHSAHDIYKLMYKNNIKMEQKSFSVGVRTEHKRADIDKIRYGDFAEFLPAADYSVFHHLADGHTAYSFCMCPGGTVVASQSDKDTVVVNGMSDFARNKENSNSAICVSVSPQDFGTGIFDGLNFTKKIEQNAFILGGKNYTAPIMKLSDFLKIKEAANIPEPTYALGVKETDFSELFPEFITNGLKEGFFAFDKIMPGFIGCGAVLTACETRTSAPLRITRNESRQSDSVFGLYPCGEGAGYAGGIVSAAADGARTALKIISEYKPTSKQVGNNP